MPAPQNFVTPQTPMGANLVPGGATFRVWAPGALIVHLVSDLSGWQPVEANKLVRDANGHWTGYWPGFSDGALYKFHVTGRGSSGYNRDPYARELSYDAAPHPFCNCVVRDPKLYPWHDTAFRTPSFHNLIIYQLHIGSFWSSRGGQQRGTFLDVVDRLPYLADLGVTAIQLLPIVEFQTAFSQGYNGTDYFSPENDYGVSDAEVLVRLPRVNALLAGKGQSCLSALHLNGPANQLRCLVDLAHLHGIAVIFDVVYNHAGGNWEEGSIYFFDRQPFGNNNDSLYFTDRGHAGGLCFAAWKPEVRQFLIDNAKFLFTEFHVDGLRHDQVSVLDTENVGSGWMFCQHLTETCHAQFPGGLQHAEYWPVNPWVVKSSAEGGAGFDTSYHDGLRDRLRDAVAQASGGAFSSVNLTAVRDVLWPPGLPQSWRGVQNLETHDEVYRDRKPRVARLAAGGGDERSWASRSRVRVATALLLTAPGIPMLFMGQEFLEDKQWADDVQNHPQLRLHWSGLESGDKQMTDFHRFVRELIQLRHRLPALRSEGFAPIHVHDANRVLAFRRWVDGGGEDVVIVASFSETTWHDYEIGFPLDGRWTEALNSDIFENWVNPWPQGNGGAIEASGPPRHDLPASARLTIPANSLLVFSRSF